MLSTGESPVLLSWVHCSAISLCPDPWTPSQQDPSKENESARWQHKIQLGSNSLTSLNNQFKALVQLHQAVPPKPSSPIYIYIIYINLKSWFLPVLWFSGGLDNKNRLICDVCTAANSTTTLANCYTHRVSSCGTKSERNRFWTQSLALMTSVHVDDGWSQVYTVVHIPSQMFTVAVTRTKFW